MMKLIWYLPTWGQKCNGKEPEPILFGKIDLGHPVVPNSNFVLKSGTNGRSTYVYGENGTFFESKNP